MPKTIIDTPSQSVAHVGSGVIVLRAEEAAQLDHCDDPHGNRMRGVIGQRCGCGFCAAQRAAIPAVTVTPTTNDLHLAAARPVAARRFSPSP